MFASQRVDGLKFEKFVCFGYAAERSIWFSLEPWTARQRARISAVATDDPWLPGFLQIERDGQRAARLNVYS